jgi:invasion protein IalB
MKINFFPVPKFIAPISSLLFGLLLSAFHQPTQAATTETFDDWKLTCEKICVLAQGLENPNNPGVLYGIQISKIESSVHTILQLNFPLGIYLPAGIGIIAGDYKQELPMTVCLPSGCRAILNLNDKLLAAINKNEKLHVRFYVSDKKPAEISFSTKGFERGYKKL